MRTASPLARVYDGVDAGYFTLPDELLTMRTALRRLTDDSPALPPRADAVRQQLITATVAAAMDGTPLPGVDTLEAARRAQTDYHDATSVRQEAVEHLAGAIRTAAADLGEQIILEHLRPAYTDTIAGLREAFAMAAPYGDSPAALLAAPRKARDAWLSIDALLSRYASVTVARFDLARIGVRPDADVNGEFSEVRNRNELFPRASQQLHPAPPWPTTSSRERLAWLFANGGELWMPTPHEQDQRYHEVYGEAIARQNFNRQQAIAQTAVWAG